MTMCALQIVFMIMIMIILIKRHWQICFFTFFWEHCYCKFQYFVLLCIDRQPG